MTRLKDIGFVVLAGLFMLSAAACSKGTDTAVGGKSEKPVLKIGYLPITHSLPVVVANRLSGDKLKSFRLELVKFSSWPELVEAFSSGKIQAASELLVLALAQAERGVPEKILSLTHRYGDIVTAAKDVRTVGDLKGKRVAIPHRMSVHNILLYRLLKQNGLSLSDVEWIEMPPPDMPAALARGDIKAYIVAEPFGAKAVLGGHGKKLIDAREIWPEYVCCGLVVNPGFEKDHPEAVQELVDSLVAAGRYIDRNREEAARIARQDMNIEEATWRQSFDWGVTYGDLRIRKEDLEALHRYTVEMGLLKGPLKIDGLFDDSYVSKAYAKAGP